MFRGKRKRTPDVPVQAQPIPHEREPFFSAATMRNMGFLFNYTERPPGYVDDLDSGELLEWLSINLIEAGDKLHALPDPDGLTDLRGAEVQRMASVLCELGRFPKEPEALDVLFTFMVNYRQMQSGNLPENE